MKSAKDFKLSAHHGQDFFCYVEQFEGTFPRVGALESGSMEAAAEGSALAASEGEGLGVGSGDNFEAVLVGASRHDTGHVVPDRTQERLPNGGVNVGGIQSNPLLQSTAGLPPVHRTS